MSFQLTRRTWFPYIALKSPLVFFFFFKPGWIIVWNIRTHSGVSLPDSVLTIFLKTPKQRRVWESLAHVSRQTRRFVLALVTESTGRPNWGCRGPGRVGAAVRQWGCFAGTRGRPRRRAASPGWRPRSWRPRRTAKIRWRPWSWRSGGGRSPLRRSCYRCGRPWVSQVC